MAKVKTSSYEVKPKLRPALTPEARELQLISLAVDLVEQRLRDGTASSQETTHFLKLGSSRARLENERLAEEIRLQKAKTKAIEAAEENTKLYAEALAAMRRYSGHADEEEIYDED